MTSSQSGSAPAPEPELPPAPMATADDSEFPRIFGNYALLAAFAQGGMGEVFLAKSGGVAGIDRLCVLKKLRRDVTQNPEYVRRFLDEVRVAVQLNHANICHIFDMGQVREEYFLAMEYVSGVNLRKLLVRSSERAVVLDEDIALYIVRETLEALDYAHRHRHPLTGKPLNLVHRDVSPQNVMLNYEGEVKLIDFGLADSDLKEEQTESKVVMGKVAYMSPEQARGDRVDGRTDQFAAGIIAYELLVGERYYGDMSAYEIWQVVGRGTFVPSRWDVIDPRLQTILGRALSAKVSDRFASCGAFQDAIDAYMGDAGRRGAQRLMRTLFEKDHDAERRFLKKFADVRVPSSDELSPREGSGRPFVLDDRSRPTTLEEAAALAESRVKAGKDASLVAATRTITAQDALAAAQTGAPVASDDGATSDQTEIVRSRTDVAAQSRAAPARVVVESSDTRAAAAAAYPNQTNRWLALAATVGVTLGVLLFFLFRSGSSDVDTPPQPTPSEIEAKQLAADKLAAEKLAADKLAADRLAADKRAAREAAEAAKERQRAEAERAAQVATDAAVTQQDAAKEANDKDATRKAKEEATARRKASEAAAKAAAAKAAVDKAAADKAAADKAAADKAAADKAAAKKKTALPASAAAPFSYDAARNALRGCSQICAVPQLRRMKGKSGTIPMAQRAGILNCAKGCK